MAGFTPAELALRAAHDAAAGQDGTGLITEGDEMSWRDGPDGSTWTIRLKAGSDAGGTARLARFAWHLNTEVVHRNGTRMAIGRFRDDAGCTLTVEVVWVPDLDLAFADRLASVGTGEQVTA